MVKAVPVLMITFLFGLTLCAQKPEEKAAQGTAVRISGCIEPGVEVGCRILRDAKTGDVYSLSFHSKSQPEAGMGVSIEGTIHNGPTSCMQGKAVDVTKWTKAEMQCGASTRKDAGLK